MEQLLAAENQRNGKHCSCQTQQDEKDLPLPPSDDPLIGPGFSTVFHDQASSMVYDQTPKQHNQGRYFETLISF
jgi:hypothetical protein